MNRRALIADAVAGLVFTVASATSFFLIAVMVSPQ